jgi:hypothetical protein
MLEPVAEIWQFFSKSKSGKLEEISKTSFGYVQNHSFQVKKMQKKSHKSQTDPNLVSR